MSGVHISQIQHANDVVLKKGTYILILGADLRPPHLSLLVDGKIFSLNVHGPQLEMPLEKQLKLIKIRKIKSLFIRLNTSIYIHDNNLFKEAIKNTLIYSKIEPGLATCLSPVKNFCAGVFGIDTGRVQTIFDLLPLLYERQLISCCFHYNMEPLLVGNSFCLNTYTLQDIYYSICRRLEAVA